MTLNNIVFYLHTSSLCLAGLGVLMADKDAFAWLMHKRDHIHRAQVVRAHWVVSAGLAGLVLTGLYMFWPMRGSLLTAPLFWIKMAFVGALIINSFFIEVLMHTPTHKRWRDLPPWERVPFIISGAVSTVSWIGAFCAAL